MWMDVIYEPGELKVVALNADGKEISEKSIHTAGKPYQLKLEADKTQLLANGKDLSYVTVSVVDKAGNECPTAINKLKFNVTGNGVFRAVCNGDATSLEMFHLPTMKLFSGKLVVTVQSSKEAGDIKLQVKGSKLKSSEIVLYSRNTPFNNILNR